MPRKPKLERGLYFHPRTGGIWTRFWVRGQEFRRSCGTRDLEAAAVEARRIRVEVEQDTSAGHSAGGQVALERLAAKDILEHQRAGFSELYLSRLESKWAVVLRNLDRVLGAELGREVEAGDITYDRLRAYEGHRRIGHRGIVEAPKSKDKREDWIDRPARGQTIVREFRLIKAALDRAKRDGDLDELPEFPKVRRDPKDKRRAGKLWPPSLVVQFLAKLHRDAYDEDVVCTVTGLRRYELKRVEAGWVEPAPQGAATPAILRAPDEATKGKVSRPVGLPQIAFDVIKRRVEAIEKERAKRGTTAAAPALVFSQSDFRKHRETVAKDLGWPAPPSKRDLRHTFATLALRRTSDPVGVMRALGHKNLKTTELYLSSTLEDVAATGAAVESALAEVRLPEHHDRSTDRAPVEKLPASAREGLERATRFELATFSLEGAGSSATWLQSLASAIEQERQRTASDVELPEHLTGAPAKRARGSR